MPRESSKFIFELAEAVDTVISSHIASKRASEGAEGDREPAGESAGEAAGHDDSPDVAAAPSGWQVYDNYATNDSGARARGGRG